MSFLFNCFALDIGGKLKNESGPLFSLREDLNVALEFLGDHFTNAEAEAVTTLILRKFLLILCAIVRLE